MNQQGQQVIISFFFHGWMDHEISQHIFVILYNQHLRKHRGNAIKRLEGKKGMGALLKKSSYSEHSYSFQHRALKSGITIEAGSSPPFKCTNL